MTQLAGADMRQLMADVYDCNVANGWFQDGRSFMTDVALLHSEVSEIFEAYRDNGFEDVTKRFREVRGLGVDFADDSKSTFEPIENPKPEGFGSECADVLVRLLDTAYRTDMDPDVLLRAARTLLEHERFGPFAEVGDFIAVLHKEISAMLTGSVNNAWARTLAFLMAGCDQYDIDLLSEFDRKLAFNRTRGFKHGGKLV